MRRRVDEEKEGSYLVAPFVSVPVDQEDMAGCCQRQVSSSSTMPFCLASMVGAAPRRACEVEW